MDHYRAAVQSQLSMWMLGYHIEDLEIKVDHQKEELTSLLGRIEGELAPRFLFSKQALRQNVRNIEYTRQARVAIHGMYRNDTSIHYITCGAGGSRLRVGSNDYRTDVRDMCQIFTSPVPELNEDEDGIMGPQAMFELVPFVEGSFGLRSVATGLFLKVVPPPNDHYLLPWKLVVGGSVVGAAESFRLSSEGYLYSPLINAFLTCSAGQMVSATVSSYGYPYPSRAFVFEEVPADELHKAYQLVDLSHKIQSIQQRSIPFLPAVAGSVSSKTIDEVKGHIAGEEAVRKPSTLSEEKREDYNIALCVPMTSKGTKMSDVTESPFWSNLFDSFMKSVDWHSNKYRFTFYIGFDQGDEAYDTGDAWNIFREEFRNRATFRLAEQRLTNEAEVEEILKKRLHVKLYHYNHLQGAPSQIVSQLVLQGYAEGMDYFYQINDDTVIISPNWAVQLIETLQNNAICPNLGVTGPVDKLNEKIFTHSFVHRLHVEIFGYHFPPAFKNWWSDDWITTVYGHQHTLTNPEVVIQHNVEAQKVKSWNRYEIDHSAQARLNSELRKGYVKIDQWLKTKGLPRMALPEVCGYIPSVRYLAPYLLKKKSEQEEDDKEENLWRTKKPKKSVQRKL
eukprot:scaffold1431_cov167-Ochromonas_danica.AAC.1